MRIGKTFTKHPLAKEFEEVHREYADRWYHNLPLGQRAYYRVVWTAQIAWEMAVRFGGY